MEPIIVFGSSGHAKVVIDIIEKQGLYEIIGVSEAEKSGVSEFCGYAILGADDDVRQITENMHVHKGIIGVGDGWTRYMIALKLKDMIPGFHYVSALHPSAQIGRGVSIGHGTVIMPGAVINSDSTIGNHCVINTCASVDHDNKIGNFVNIQPNAATGGNVIIDNFSVLAIGATVIDKVKIGANSLVGAGSVVTKDISSDVVVFGAPARIQRNRESRWNTHESLYQFESQ